MRKLDYNVYLDKVLGCWYGKSIGGTVGAPLEGHKMLGDLTKENCWPSIIYPNDDLDIQVVWLEMLEELGVYPTKYDYVNLWRDRCWYNFAEYGYFLYNVQRGIHPPLSGEYNNEFYRECEGCPIRAEIWGAVAPGDIELAADMARVDGELDHIGISVDAERFWAAAISEAFFTDDLMVALEAGRSVLDDDCLIAQIYDETPAIMEKAGNIPLAWRLLVRKFGHRDNSKAETNFAFSIMALLDAKDDFKQIIVHATNFGWDSDCTAATAGALWGTLKGAKNLPADWMEKMGERLACDCNVRHRTALMVDFAADTCKVGIEMLQRNTNATIVNVPQEVMDEVAERIKSRRKTPVLSWDIDYAGDPVLPIDGEKNVFIQVQASTETKFELSVEANGVDVELDRTVLAPFPGVPEWIGVTVKRQPSDTIWDKNLIKLIAKNGDEVVGEFEFGLAGERPWIFYGPYWHAWRVDKDEICPFKNDKVMANPCSVGYGEALSNNFVFMDREYLDEEALIKGALPEEGPELYKAQKDNFYTGDMAGYVGGCVYYFVRELVATEDTEVMITLGCDSPYRVWYDGVEMQGKSDITCWTPWDTNFKAAVGPDRPRRLVIKMTRIQDDARLSVVPLKVDVTGDKMIGHSYVVDTLGYKIIKG